MKQIASHVFVDCEADLGHVLHVVADGYGDVTETLDELVFVGVACVLAPQSLEVDGANRAIFAENSIDLLEVSSHNCHLIGIAADGLGSINEWANALELKIRNEIEWSRGE